MAVLWRRVCKHTLNHQVNTSWAERSGRLQFGMPVPKENHVPSRNELNWLNYPLVGNFENELKICLKYS